MPDSFLNDAKAFALGVAGKDNNSVLAITLGTGLGSGFIKNGVVCDSSCQGVPAN